MFGCSTGIHIYTERESTQREKELMVLDWILVRLKRQKWKTKGSVHNKEIPPSLRNGTQTSNNFHVTQALSSPVNLTAKIKRQECPRKQTKAH